MKRTNEKKKVEERKLMKLMDHNLEVAGKCIYPRFDKEEALKIIEAFSSSMITEITFDSFILKPLTEIVYPDEVDERLIPREGIAVFFFPGTRPEKVDSVMRILRGVFPKKYIVVGD